jgi:hypothetical protein
MTGWHILLKQKWLVLRMVIMGIMCSWFAVGSLSSFSVTIIGNRLAYITSIGWREISPRKILVISILGNKLCKNMLSFSYLFFNWAKIFLHPYLLHTYARLLLSGRKLGIYLMVSAEPLPCIDLKTKSLDGCTIGSYWHWLI